MISTVITQLLEKKNLSQKQAYDVMAAIMAGEITPSQIAGFLVALSGKGETADEIAGCALAMRDASRSLTLKASVILDSCGTGGDGRSSINISTAAAFVVAGAGFTIAKHGNRAISSKCGSADVLEAMGIRVDPPLALVEQCLNEQGMGFLFAPSFHPAMRHAMPTRKELGIRTIFNMLGPLTNPARANVQLMGVFDVSKGPMIAQVLKKMGHKAALVVHSEGWDEITLHGKTKVIELLNGKTRSYTLSFSDFGLPRVPSKNLAGGTIEQNANALTQILEAKPHPAVPVVVANAAALIWIAERAQGNKKATLKESVRRAEESIRTGAALDKSRRLAQITHIIE